MKKYTEQIFENKKSGMTVGDLRKIIQDLDDNMRIGGSGHFGEYLECLDIHTCDVSIGHPLGKRSDNAKETILAISIEDPGEEPN